jgi:transitional endoplasmic reticulum ATPase
MSELYSYAKSRELYMAAHYPAPTKESVMPPATANGKQTDEDKTPRKVDVAYAGDKIILPLDMDLEEGREALTRQIQEESVEVKISESIDAFPFDGAVALARVLKRRYGWTHLKPTDMGFFGSYPPSLIGVETSFGQREQIPWGNMSVPKVDGLISTSHKWVDGVPQFVLSGTVKRKSERTLQAIAQEVRDEVRKNSIYRGQMVKINFRDNNGDRKEFDFNLCPKFIDMSRMGDTTPIFSKVIEDAIRINVLTPIRHSARCRTKGASLKKGIMLGGPYGTGKTLTAFQIAQVCVANGWTFLYLEDVRDLDLAIGFARLYGPCVLFAEDMDKAAHGPRTSEMDRLLNTIDGVESKGDIQLITVLTTNHLNAINPAFLRPGRIDAVINVTPPDDEACLRIVKKYVSDGGCKLEGGDEELMAAIKPLVGANAAFFRNTVEQAKLAAIENMPEDDAPVVIRPDDLKTVAEAMVPHCKLINPEHGVKPLLDLNAEEKDPITFATEIFFHKAAEAILEMVTDPKVLQKVIVKKMRPRGMGGMGPHNLN